MMNKLNIQEYIPGIRSSKTNNFFLFAGPCVVEGRTMAFEIAEHIKTLSEKYDIPFVFKASYRKANRSRLDSFSGIGDTEALKILGSIREKYNIPVITDIHSADEADFAARYVDVLQIPAFLCRQTDILIAAAKTGKAVSIKKGQFLSPSSMLFAINKVKESGNEKVIVTERGTTFGYQDLVVDFRSIPEMQKMGVPVVMDITHSLQEPNQQAGITGGRPEMIETIARAAIATGADGIFIETHPEPASALSDGANMLKLELLDGLLSKLTLLRKTILEFQTL